MKDTNTVLRKSKDDKELYTGVVEPKDTPIDTSYNLDDSSKNENKYRPATNGIKGNDELVNLVDKNGKIYTYFGHKDNSANVKGKVTENPQTIVFEYVSLAGGKVNAQYFIKDDKGSNEQLVNNSVQDNTSLFEDTEHKTKFVIPTGGDNNKVPSTDKYQVGSTYRDTPPDVLTKTDANGKIHKYKLVKLNDAPELKEGSAPHDGRVTEEVQTIIYMKK